jgi:hypothetical protein
MYCQSLCILPWTGGVAQVVEGFLCKPEALSSKLSPAKKKKLHILPCSEWHIIADFSLRLRLDDIYSI